MVASIAIPIGIFVRKFCSISFQLLVRRLVVSRRKEERVAVVSLAGEGAERKSRNISGRHPRRPSKLGLWRLGHLSCDLTEFVAVIARRERTVQMVQS